MKKIYIRPFTKYTDMKKMFKRPLLLLVLILVSFCMIGFNNDVTGSSQPPMTPYCSSDERSSSWLNQTQVFDMLALPPNRVKAFHVTVNGLWNGFFVEGENLSGPFEFGRYLESFYSGRTYQSDADFVQAQHNQGLLVPATILTTQGHHALQGDLIESFACRSADGKMATWDLTSGSKFICSQNPDAIDWMITHGKKAIDAGADMITLDEIEGNGLVCLLQYVAPYAQYDEPGFCQYCLEGFRMYLGNHFSSSDLSDLFGIDALEAYDFLPRIAATMNMTYYQRITADPLIKEYIRFQEQGTFAAKKRLITELRNYSASQGKDIIISANCFALGTSQTGGYWIQGLQFSNLVDFFSFETKYTALPDESFPALPRSKWVAWEKLARAATNAPGVILVDSGAMGKIWNQLFYGGKLRNYLAVHCAEAYANQGAFVNWFMKPYDTWFRWSGCAKVYDFILRNRELYDTPSKIDTDVAVLYLFSGGMRNNTENYLGLCQLLAESNIPYDVKFGGDGYYLNDTLTLENLSSYQMLIVPSVVGITTYQQTLLKNYVHSGGIALIFDPQELGFPSEEGPYVYGNGTFYFMLEKTPAQYYLTYDDSYRVSVVETLRTYIGESLRIDKANRRVVGYPYYQPDANRIVLHLVNYDRGALFDIIWSKSNIAVHLNVSLSSVHSVSVVSPDFSGTTTILFTITGDSLDFIVPSLRFYDVVVIEQ